jgi:16S rRNA (guanine527-N7)-methyltransferase
MSFLMEPEDRKLLIEGAKVFGIHLDEKGVQAFEIYLRELLKWNQKINLTAIRTEKGIILKHFLDSLSVHPYLLKPASLLDIGSGAGFPGIPLKIVDPSLEITLIDSIQKKVDFQKHIIRILDLKGIQALHGRVHDQEILQGRVGRFDIVISRAFSDLESLLFLSFPFLKEGGILLAMKGERGQEGVQFLSEAVRSRYRLQKIVPLLLPYSPIKRTLLLFEKI